MNLTKIGGIRNQKKYKKILNNRGNSAIVAYISWIQSNKFASTYNIGEYFMVYQKTGFDTVSFF